MQVIEQLVYYLNYVRRLSVEDIGALSKQGFCTTPAYLPACPGSVDCDCGDGEPLTIASTRGVSVPARASCAKDEPGKLTYKDADYRTLDIRECDRWSKRHFREWRRAARRSASDDVCFSLESSLEHAEDTLSFLTRLTDHSGRSSGWRMASREILKMTEAEIAAAIRMLLAQNRKSLFPLLAALNCTKYWSLPEYWRSGGPARNAWFSLLESEETKGSPYEWLIGDKLIREAMQLVRASSSVFRAMRRTWEEEPELFDRSLRGTRHTLARWTMTIVFNATRSAPPFLEPPRPKDQWIKGLHLVPAWAFPVPPGAWATATHFDSLRVKNLREAQPTPAGLWAPDGWFSR